MRLQVRVSTLPVSGRSYDRWGVDLTCVRSTVRSLAPPYLRPTSFPRRVSHVDGPVVRCLPTKYTDRTAINSVAFEVSGREKKAKLRLRKDAGTYVWVVRWTPAHDFYGAFDVLRSGRRSGGGSDATVWWCSRGRETLCAVWLLVHQWLQRRYAPFTHLLVVVFIEHHSPLTSTGRYPHLTIQHLVCSC
ncbi:hypothetical protein GW17_00011528 [Ensete ventricosum]|nr:hypothetical protein GW17_00011528 [Ensete ventricosum]